MHKKYKQVLLGENDDLLCDNDKLESFDVKHVECDDELLKVNHLVMLARLGLGNHLSGYTIIKLTCDILCWLMVIKKCIL